MQAWLEEALDIQPNSSRPSESQTPCQWEERSASATAGDGPDHPHTELQVRVLMTKDLLLKQSHASALLPLYGSSGVLRAISSSTHSSQLMHIWLGQPIYITCSGKLHFI